MNIAGQMVAFAGVVGLGAVSPGPDFAVVVRRSVVAGRRHGMAAAAGVAAGVLVWSTAAAVGVSALLAASAVAFAVVKAAGAAYLLWLGVVALLAARRGGGPVTAAAGPRATVGLWVSFRDGLLCNVLNPKAGVFFIAVLPQFAPAGGSALEAVVLSSVAVAITLVWFTVVANLVAVLRRVFARPAVRRAVDAVTGAVLVSLGVRLAISANT
jgi:threonine/homoserine/homoserine lactone efflux protein